MGLRDRLKGKIKEAVQGVGALAKIIQDEANHPGRPQPHMAARNPLWGGGDVRDSQQEMPESEENASPTVQTEPSKASLQSTPAEEGDFWFLNSEDGEVDDWSQTNPKS